MMCDLPAKRLDMARGVVVQSAWFPYPFILTDPSSLDKQRTDGELQSLAMREKSNGVGNCTNRAECVLHIRWIGCRTVIRA
jgi:hypothetical protein